MKMVYTHENIIYVGHYQNLLKLSGIDAVIKNQFLGGAAGELGLSDVWPQLWVIDDAQFEQAKLLIAEEKEQSFSQASWVCPNCHEKNEGSFEFCWNCQTPAP